MFSLPMVLLPSPMLDDEVVVMISLNGVSKRYQLGGETIMALDNVDFSVAKGEFVAIVGSSGSGKSTLMNMIGLLDVPNSGSYMLEGKNVYHLTDNQLARLRNQKVGFVFQSFNLLSSMSAFENVRLPLLYRGVGKRQADKIVNKYFQQLGLEGREHHLPSQLSGGQQQRVAIARALVGNPEIVLADEPTGALDTKTSSEIMEVFHSLNSEGQTIILITHNLSLARQASRIMTMVDGKIYKEVMAGYEGITSH